MNQQPLNWWVEKLGGNEFPILRKSHERLTALAQRQEALTGEVVAYEISHDPFLVINLFRKVESMPRSFLAGDITTLDRAVMMMGMGSFFAWIRGLPILEEVLHGKVAVLEPLKNALACHYHAAFQAWHWALLRKDISADEVFIAALIQHALCWVGWLRVPDDMEIMRKYIYQDHMNLSSAFHRHTGHDIDRLQLELTHAWKLPEIYLDFTHGHTSNRGVSIPLALTLIENTQLGWGSPAIEDIVEQAAEWLQLDAEDVMEHIYSFSDKATDHSYEWYGTAIPLIVWKPIEPANWQDFAEKDSHELKPASESVEQDPSAPAYIQYEHEMHPAIVQRAIADVRTHLNGDFDINQLMARVMTAMHDGLAMDRVVFAVIGADQTLNTRFSRGVDEHAPLYEMSFKLGERHLFSQLMNKMQAVWFQSENSAKLSPFITPEISRFISQSEFMAMSVLVHGKPVGFFYADYGNKGRMNASIYAGFKQLCLLTAEGIGKLQKGDPR